MLQPPKDLVIRAAEEPAHQKMPKHQEMPAHQDIDVPVLREVHVDLGERSYQVVVGRGARRRLGGLIPSTARKAAVVTQQNIPWEVDCATDQRTFLVGAGEEAKTLDSVEALCRGFAEWGMHRGDVVVAVGGGVVTDVAGFAAAVYHRGIAVIHVATTLLGQIDAAVGGKTGVNLPEGKNLVGAFWQPSAVLCDTETLDTLPERETRSGLGEMAKYRFLGVSGLTEMGIDEAVAACVEAKATIVGADERESGRRALLNYGHTLGHALETSGSYDLTHGEAVGIGMVFAAHLARALGRIDDSRVALHEQTVAGYGLPVRPPSGRDPRELIELMRRDKKSTGSELTFVLEGPGGVEVVENVAFAVVHATLDEFVT